MITLMPITIECGLLLSSLNDSQKQAQWQDLGRQTRKASHTAKIGQTTFHSDYSYALTIDLHSALSNNTIDLAALQD